MTQRLELEKPRSHGSRSPDFLWDALASPRRTSGSTHNFYLYPARFSPQAAAAVISVYSQRDEWILDPFMGGGTAVVEALMAGRKIIGADLNALGHFVATARTTPLSNSDQVAIRSWAAKIADVNSRFRPHSTSIPNLPRAVKSFSATAIALASMLPLRRQRRFARCALLRLGQWALDCRDCTAPDWRELAARLPQLVEQMLEGLRQFVDRCAESGLSKSEITSRRLLLWGDARTTVTAALNGLKNVRPKLILTSPPYPKVHVLYHRWQVGGRSETPAPYWIANVPDGYCASHYTGGSRTATGERRYFRMIRDVFSALKSVVDADASVAQLVGFADVNTQLPMYLRAMTEAGFEEDRFTARERFWRRVPNRKWHARLKGRVDASSEVFLLHHPLRRRQPSG